jgi:hypothetical protein
MGFKEIFMGIITLLSLVKDLLDIVKEMKKKKGKQVVNDTHLAVKELKNAKTPEDKKRAAKKLADLIGSID